MYMNINICMYTYIHIYIYIHACMYMYMYIYKGESVEKIPGYLVVSFASLDGVDDFAHPPRVHHFVARVPARENQVRARTHQGVPRS